MSLLPSLSSRQRDGVLSRQRDGVLFSPHWPPTSASQEQLPSNLHTGIHVNFYTNMVSDRVGDKPQTLILPLTRSIPLWARVIIGESRFPSGKWN
jgi:hypothetical protein